MPRKKSRHRREGASSTPIKSTGAQKRPAPSPAASPQAAHPSSARKPRRSPRADAALKKKQWLELLLGASHNSHVLLLDLDNWPTFFANMRWESLPSNVYLAACYRAATFSKPAHEKQLHGKCTTAMLKDHRLLYVPSLASKDSADSEIIALAKDVEHIVKQRDGLSRLWISIISGDHIFKQTQETMSRSLPILTCSQRDYAQLAVLLEATGTCLASQLMPAPASEGGYGCGSNGRSSSARTGREHEQHQQKRARLHRAAGQRLSGGRVGDRTAPMSACSSSAPSGEIDGSEKAALATLGPLSMSSIQFNAGATGSTGKAKGRSQRRRGATRVTLGSCIGAVVLQNSTGKTGGDKQQQDQRDDWPALPKPSPVKLTFAQALQGMTGHVPKSPQPAGASGDGAGGRQVTESAGNNLPVPAGVFRFGQANSQATRAM